MTNIKVVDSDSNSNIKVRIGQQNSVKIVSSTLNDLSFVSENVIGGIASVTSLSVSGASNFTGVSTFSSDVYFLSNVYYQNYSENGIAYFNDLGVLTSTGSTSNSISETNYILTTNQSGIPIWSNVIDGGTY